MLTVWLCKTMHNITLQQQNTSYSIILQLKKHVYTYVAGITRYHRVQGPHASSSRTWIELADLLHSRKSRSTVAVPDKVVRVSDVAGLPVQTQTRDFKHGKHVILRQGNRHSGFINYSDGRCILNHVGCRSNSFVVHKSEISEVQRQFNRTGKVQSKGMSLKIQVKFFHFNISCQQKEM